MSRISRAKRPGVVSNMISFVEDVSSETHLPQTLSRMPRAKRRILCRGCYASWPPRVALGSPRLGSPRFGPLLARCVSSRFGRAPILVRPASELNRFLRSNWSSAARNSTTTSFGRAVHSGSLSLISKSVRPSFGHQGGRLDPQRNGALHRSTRHGADQFSTARRSAAQGRPA